jgi:heterodisulfide reductase subunit A-like polyferredoxin
MKSSVLSERLIEKEKDRQTVKNKDTQGDRHMDRRTFFKTLALASSAALVDWTGMGALADSVKNKADFPVVIIGSGLGGLVCGAYLSRFGFDVTMLEQHGIPGGMPRHSTGGISPLTCPCMPQWRNMPCPR